MSNSEDRHRRHTREKFMTWVVALLVLALLAAGLIFGVKMLKKPVGDAISSLIPKREAEPESEPEEPQPQETAAEKPMDEETLSAIFEDNEEEEEIVAGTDEDEALRAEASALVDKMSLEHKLAQLFFVTPESITGVETATAAGEKTRLALAERPVGGIILAEQNIVDPEQLKAMTSGLQRFSTESAGVPVFIGVEEEGGSDVKLASNPAFEMEYLGDVDLVHQRVNSMSEIGESKDASKAYMSGYTIGTYLAEYGINVDIAPVADVRKEGEEDTDDSQVKGPGKRSFGDDPQLVADMTMAFINGLHDANVLGMVKHFPGMGCVSEDVGDGRYATDKDWGELENRDLIPFKKAVKDGAKLLMAGHISVPELTGDEIPASMSAIMLTQKLRLQMGYTGVIVTDAMCRETITGSYSSSEAAIAAISAGADMIMMPADFNEAYEGVLSAVQAGSISEERINESAVRIVTAKLILQKAQAAAQEEAEAADGEEGTETDAEGSAETDTEAGEEENTEAGEQAD